MVLGYAIDWLQSINYYQLSLTIATAIIDVLGTVAQISLIGAKKQDGVDLGFGGGKCTSH